MRDRFESLTPELIAFVRHLASCGYWDISSSTVDGDWEQRARGYLEAAEARELVTVALTQLADAGWLYDAVDVDARASLGQPLSHGFAKAGGLLAVAGASEGEVADVVGSLVRLVRVRGIEGSPTQPRDDDLARAAIISLAELGAADALWALHREVPREVGYRHDLTKAAEKVAKKARLKQWQLAERTVPTESLDSNRERTVYCGPGDAAYQTVIALSPTGTVTIDWIDAAGSRKQTTSPHLPPRSFREKRLRPHVEAVQRHAKQIEGTLAAEVDRIRGLITGDQTWPFAEWTWLYREHPITSVVAFGLVWEFERAAGEWIPGLADIGDGFLVAGGSTATVQNATRIRLWNPLHASEPDLHAVTMLVAEYEVQQPIPQLYGA